MSKVGHLEKMNCNSCGFMNSVKVTRRVNKTDDGDIHYKYIDEWVVDCKKEGIVKGTLEGTRYRATVPTCSLWVPKVIEK